MGEAQATVLKTDKRLPRMELEAKALELARAVLLFHGGAVWTPDNASLWQQLTGEREATTRVLCDVARRLIEHLPETEKSDMASDHG